MQLSYLTRSLSIFPCPRSVACRPDFHKIYQLGALIGEGAFSKVHLATVKAAGLHKDMQVAVKCIDRDGMPLEDEEDIQEEVRKTGRSQRREWSPSSTNSVD